MNALRLAGAVAIASALLGTAALGACGPNSEIIWFCIDPATGKLDDNAPYDPNHSVDGVFDPCHCYDPTGPRPQCPFLIDAGPDVP